MKLSNRASANFPGGYGPVFSTNDVDPKDLPKQDDIAEGVGDEDSSSR